MFNENNTSASGKKLYFDGEKLQTGELEKTSKTAGTSAENSDAVKIHDKSENAKKISKKKSRGLLPEKR